MSCNLFSCFDPYVNLMFLGFFSFKWLAGMTIFFFLNWQFFTCKSSISLVLKKVQLIFLKSFSSLIKELKESFLILLSLFLSIILINIIGLWPFTLSVSSHLSMNLSFSLSLWLSGVLISITKSINSFLSHMVPTGTPTILWVFLVMVETVSLIIRPFTLSIRLMANVMAGHLVLSLMGTLVSTSPLFSILLMFQSMFISFEVCISMVQAYVFVSLLSLYWDES